MVKRPPFENAKRKYRVFVLAARPGHHRGEYDGTGIEPVRGSSASAGGLAFCHFHRGSMVQISRLPILIFFCPFSFFLLPRCRANFNYSMYETDSTQNSTRTGKFLDAAGTKTAKISIMPGWYSMLFSGWRTMTQVSFSFDLSRLAFCYDIITRALFSRHI